MSKRLNQFMTLSVALLFHLILNVNCGLNSSSDKLKYPEQVSGHNYNSIDNEYIPVNNEISTKPEIFLPAEFSDYDIFIEESTIDLPSRIDEKYVPIGKIYEISLLNEENVHFETGFAELKYTYDPTKLWKVGLIEDFQVFYFDTENGIWNPVDSINVDRKKCTITAKTSHFTPFVLTASIFQWYQVGNVINTETRRNTLSGSIAFNGPFPYVAWTEYDNSMYYNIFVKRWDGISWQNIGSNINHNRELQCGKPSIAMYGSLAYISWHENNEYNRGQVFVKKWNETEWVLLGSELNRDKNRDALNPKIVINETIPYVVWSESNGFWYRNNVIYVKRWDGYKWINLGGSLNIDQHLDAYNPEMIFINSIPYVAWSECNSLNCNIYVKHWNGFMWVQDGDKVNIIDSNVVHCSISMASDGLIPYVVWDENNGAFEQVHVRRLEDNIWVDVGDSINIDQLSNAVGGSISISNDIPYIAWQEDTADTTKVFAKYWTGDEWVRAGEDLNVHKNEAAICSGLFMNDLGLPYVLVSQLTKVPGYIITNDLYVKGGNYKDSDFDGLTDGYEEITEYPDSPYIHYTDPYNNNTDGDSYDDGVEVAIGTDPTNPDDVKPEIIEFILTSPSQTDNPIVTFIINGTDNVGITHWLVTNTGGYKIFKIAWAEPE